jgi:fucose 4-O-acetylase-like acetyltransferase
MNHTLEKTRISQIDTLRGVACLLLVFFHVVGDSPAAGLKLAEEHWLHRINGVIAYLRMPLFAFIAGYVYAYRPFQGQTSAFVKSKAQRLLLPVITVGTVFALVQASIPGTNNQMGPWWMLHINPVGHFWFLESLFIVFMVVILFEQTKVLTTPSQVMLAWSSSALLFALWDAPAQFGLGGAVYLMPFFLGGLASKRFEYDREQFMKIAVVGLALAAIYAALLHGEAAQPDLATVVLGLSASFLLLQSRIDNRFFACIGAFSFAVYLLHVFFTAGSRIVLTRLGVDDTYLLLAAGMVAGVTGPIIAALLIKRVGVLNFLLLGHSLKPRPAPARARAAIQTSRRSDDRPGFEEQIGLHPRNTRARGYLNDNKR